MFPVMQRHLRQQLARGAVADGGVILQTFHGGLYRPIACRHPADAQSRQPIGLRHHSQGHGALGQVAGRREPVRRIMLRASIDLVGEEHRSPFIGDLAQSFEIGPRHQVTSGVVGRVDHHRPGARSDEPLQLPDVQRPIPWSCVPSQYLAPDAPCHLLQRLVAGGVHHHLITGSEHGVHEQEYRLLRPAVDHHLLRANGPVHRGYGLPERGRTGRFGVAQAQGGKPMSRLWLQG